MSLFAAEVRRGLARRSTRLLVALAVLVIAAMGLLVFTSSRAGVATQAARDDAALDRAAQIRDCIASNGFGGEVQILPGQDVQEACEASTGPVDSFVQDKRFKLVDLWPGKAGDGVLSITALFLVIGALMAGATFIGGDWRAGTVGTLLTWEPRRQRVFLAKAAAVTAVSLVIGVLLQALVSTVLLPSALWHGTTDGADADWFQGLVGATLRTAAIGAGAALVGYAIAMIGRNTAAALGIAFGYFAVAEPLIRGLKPEWQPWLIGDNSTVVIFGRQLREAPFERTLAEAVLILGAYLLLVLGVSAVSFSRRDVAA